MNPETLEEMDEARTAQEIPQGELYVGAKLIRAYPQEKDGKPGYSVRFPDGYLSWSPKETFETAYRLVTEEEKNFSR